MVRRLGEGGLVPMLTGHILHGRQQRGPIGVFPWRAIRKAESAVFADWLSLSQARNGRACKYLALGSASSWGMLMLSFHDLQGPKGLLPHNWC